MCNAFAEIGLFVLTYLVCSRCRISIDLPAWPTYDLLHVLHCNLYIPLEFILLCGVMSHNLAVYSVICSKSIFKSVLFNTLVTLCMSGL